MKLVIKCKTGESLPLASLIPFQGELKTLSQANYDKLKTRILSEGFKFPFFVWKKGKKVFLIDGHQRHKTLTKLASEGYEIPDVPVVPIDAKNMKEAKQNVLAAASQFGDISQGGLFDFMVDADLDRDSVFSTTNFQGFNTEAFNKSFFGAQKGSVFDKDEDPNEEKPERAGSRKEYDRNTMNENEEVETLMGFKTAIARTDVSLPIRWYEDKDLLQGDVLDFGAGQDPHKFNRYDPYYDFDPSVLKFRYDTVTCNYVLNVQPHVGGRLSIALAVRGLLNSTEDAKAYFSVMTKAENGGEEGVVRSVRGFQAFMDPVVYENELKQIFGKVKRLRYAPFPGWECRP